MCWYNRIKKIWIRNLFVFRIYQKTCSYFSHYDINIYCSYSLCLHKWNRIEKLQIILHDYFS